MMVSALLNKLEGKFFLFTEQEKKKILKAFLRIPCQITHMSGFFCARISNESSGKVLVSYSFEFDSECR
jgi:hypothetical protein